MRVNTPSFLFRKQTSFALNFKHRRFENSNGFRLTSYELLFYNYECFSLNFSISWQYVFLFTCVCSKNRSVTWRFNSVFSLRPCFFATLRYVYAFAISAVSSLTSAATAQQLHSGGISRAIRCKCVISVASAEPIARQKCQFSGFAAASHLSFRRKLDTKIANFAFCAFRSLRFYW